MLIKNEINGEYSAESIEEIIEKLSIDEVKTQITTIINIILNLVEEKTEELKEISKTLEDLKFTPLKLTEAKSRKALIISLKEEIADLTYFLKNSHSSADLKKLIKLVNSNDVFKFNAKNIKMLYSINGLTDYSKLLMIHFIEYKNDEYDRQQKAKVVNTIKTNTPKSNLVESVSEPAIIENYVPNEVEYEEIVEKQTPTFLERSLNFYSSISGGVTVNDLFPLIPSIEDKDYYLFKKEVLSFFEKEYTELLKNSFLTDSEEDRIFYLDSSDEVRENLLALSNYFKRQEKGGEAETVNAVNDIYFASSQTDEYYILSDILSDVHQKTASLLSLLQTVELTNPRNFKQSNEAGVYCVSSGTTKLYFKILNERSIYVVSVAVEKNHYAKVDSNRVKKTKLEFEQLKESIKQGFVDIIYYDKQKQILDEIIQLSKQEKNVL